MTAGGRERILLPRTVVLVQANVPFQVVPGAEAEVGHLAFCRSIVEPEALGPAADRVLEMLGTTETPAARDGGIRASRLAPAAFEEAFALYRGIEDETRGRQLGFQAMQRLRLMELLVLLSRCGSPVGAVASPRPEPSRIEEVIAYIRDHSGDELSLAGLASRFGLNPSYLSRAFPRRTGVHLVEYVNRMRIEKSCLLLKRPGMSILEIALWVGYNNVSYFNRYFRRITGMSPREYRKRSGR